MSNKLETKIYQLGEAKLDMVCVLYTYDELGINPMYDLEVGVDEIVAVKYNKWLKLADKKYMNIMKEYGDTVVITGIYEAGVDTSPDTEMLVEVLFVDSMQKIIIPDRCIKFKCECSFDTKEGNDSGDSNVGNDGNDSDSDKKMEIDNVDSVDDGIDRENDNGDSSSVGTSMDYDTGLENEPQSPVCQGTGPANMVDSRKELDVEGLVEFGKKEVTKVFRDLIGNKVSNISRLMEHEELDNLMEDITEELLGTISESVVERIMVDIKQDIGDRVLNLLLDIQDKMESAIGEIGAGIKLEIFDKN